MLKIFLSTALLVGSAIANDDMIIKFEKKRFSQNSQIELKEVKINTKKKINEKDWYGYIMDITATVQGKELKAKDMLFSNGSIVAPDLLDIKTGKSLKALLSPELTAVYYNKAHLIAGNPKAKDKIVIFSDPLCPFCMDYVPDVINHVKKNSDSIALYYYHFPLLRLHPAANTLTKLMDVARHKGVKEVELRTYDIDWSKYFSENEKSDQKIIDAFNKEFKTSIQLTDLMTKKVIDTLKTDMKMGEEVMVQGTPTIFINGIKDNSKLKYETLGK